MGNRLFIPGYEYHIITRENEIKNIFMGDGHRKKFCKSFKKQKGIGIGENSDKSYKKRKLKT